ncbi:MAG: methyltransferase domain-containing protein [Thermaerobacter sp.]|nr:methyltransferase domain-containing protein [Thermaerobacter sp.]
MTEADRRRWNSRYRAQKAAMGHNTVALPDRVLVEVTRSLAPGRAVDVACGMGRNALWLARQGWQVDAIDIAREALEELRQAAESRMLDRLFIMEEDLDAWRPAPNTYDFGTMVLFWDPRVLAHLKRAVRPGGLVLVRSLLAPSGQPDVGPHYLRPGELREWFKGWTIRHNLEDEGMAMILAVRPLD